MEQEATLRTVTELKRVCVFCGSSSGTNPANEYATIELANAMVERGIDLVYGGGKVGLMGLVADTVLAGGGNVLGIIPRNLFSREVAHRGITELVETENMHERKAAMYDAADAFVALPGGFGTMDELMEITTWRQIGSHAKPVGLVDTDGYYTGLLTWLNRAVTDGLVSASNARLLLHAPTAPELLDLLAADDHVAAPKWDS